MFRLSIAALLVTVTPVLATAQQAGADAAAGGSVAVSTSGTKTSVTGDATADARIDGAAARLAAEGVSSASLTSRAQLGRARGVEPARIAASIEQRADALLSADRALRASGTAHAATTLELAADAIESGAHASQIAQVVTGFEAALHARALAALGVLAAEGRIGANVLGSVRSAMEAGVGADAAAAAGAATAVTGTATSVGASGAVNAVGTAGGAAAGAGAAVGGTLHGGLPR